MNFFAKKSAGSYINLFAAIFALAITIVYTVYSKTYGLFEIWPAVCFAAVAVLNLVLFFFETNVNEYIKIVAVFVTALATALFLVAFGGDISDYFNQVNYAGRGAAFKDIVSIAIVMIVLIITQVVSCFFGKKSD